MTRLDELDREPFRKGQRAAIIAIAEWWFDRLSHQRPERHEFAAFLRERFGFAAKRCIGTCGRWKPDYDFPPSRKCKDGRRNLCRECDNERKKAWRRSLGEDWRVRMRPMWRKLAERKRKLKAAQ